MILTTSVLSGEDRYPRPDFESDYITPEEQIVEPAGPFQEYIDLAVLFIVLALSVFFVFKLRSRNLIFLLTLFSLLYFGFYRKGCICSVGAIQNIIYSMFSPGYLVPFTVAAFFFLPILCRAFF